MESREACRPSTLTLASHPGRCRGDYNQGARADRHGWRPYVPVGGGDMAGEVSRPSSRHRGFAKRNRQRSIDHVSPWFVTT